MGDPPLLRSSVILERGSQGPVQEVPATRRVGDPRLQGNDLVIAASMVVAEPFVDVTAPIPVGGVCVVLAGSTVVVCVIDRLVVALVFRELPERNESFLAIRMTRHPRHLHRQAREYAET